MKFFRTLFSVCRELRLFPEIARQPLWRSLLHLSLLATFLSALITGLRIPEIHGNIKLATAKINAEFGDIKVTPEGFTPSVEPERPRRIELFPGTRLEYFPDTGFSEKDIRIDGNINGIIWTPGITVLWIKTGNGFMLFPINYTPRKLRELGKANMMPATPAGIAGFMKDFDQPAGPFIYNSLKELSRTTQRTIAGAVFVLELLRIFLGGILFTTIFTGCFSIGGGAAMLGMRYRNFWNIGLYAGFPPMIVAAVITGMELPYFDFSTIYLFGMLGYFFVIIGNMQRQRMKNAAKNGEESK